MDLSVDPDKGIIEQELAIDLTDANEKVLLSDLDVRAFSAVSIILDIENWVGTSILRVKSKARYKSGEPYEEVYTPKATITEGEIAWTPDTQLFQQSQIGTPSRVNMVFQVANLRFTEITAQDTGAGGMQIRKITVVPGPGF